MHAPIVQNWDYIIVGSGSAGSPMANRLSGRSTNKVLLLEAGADFEPGTEPLSEQAAPDRRISQCSENTTSVHKLLGNCNWPKTTIRIGWFY